MHPPELPSPGTSESVGDHYIRWIETVCRIPEGKDVGKPVVLREWQRDIIRRIYDNPHGTRRAIISFGRKNAKTTLCAFLLLLHLVGPAHKPNSQLYSTAQSREQASALFSLAAKMVRMSPDLHAFVIIRDTAKHLYCSHLGTIYKALSADAATAYGLSPVFVVHDELGQVRGPRSDLYSALETAGAAHESPLSIVISTQAADDLDLLSKLIDDAKTERDPRTVLALYTADPALDPFAEETIRLANPAFGDFQNASEILAMAEDSRRMPAQENAFRNLILNQRILSYSPFVSMTVWDENAGLPPEDFEGFDVYGGLDLAYNGDLASLVLVAKHEGKWAVKAHFWVPEGNIEKRSREESVPYDLWHREGLLVATPGNSIQYEYIAHALKEIFDQYSVARISYDPWRWDLMRPVLEREGFGDAQFEKFVEFVQGYKSMTPAVGCLEMLLNDAKISHGGNPVLRNCAANAVVESDPAGNRKFNKKKSRGRIDGIVALAMACVTANTITAPVRSIFDDPETATVNAIPGNVYGAPNLWDLDFDNDAY